MLSRNKEKNGGGAVL